MKGWIRNALIVAVILVCVGTPLLMHNIQVGSDPQLKILREMAPYWIRAESGGIVLIAEPPNERAMVTYRALLASPADGSGDRHGGSTRSSDHARSYRTAGLLTSRYKGLPTSTRRDALGRNRFSSLRKTHALSASFP